MIPELLAPAGNMERLRAALHFGADAAYVGMRSMSLRNMADNLTPEELASACALAHSVQKRIYVACNAFARDEDMAALPALLSDIRDAGADALIVSDPGVIRVCSRTVPELPIHLSTQANTLNTEAALFWREQGVSRIVLARELSIAEVKHMRRLLPESILLEYFVHGAMCISYSGRCLLSNYLSPDGRDSYRGECVQPCRWTYELRERGKDGEYFPVEQEGRGTYIFNSRDLNLMALLPDMIDAGIASVKIEGRMKSIAYVATVVNAYRIALDALAAGQAIPEPALRELDKASHRPYTTGFALGDPGAAGQYPVSAQYVSDERICAVVEDYDPVSHIASLVQRNRFYDGDTLGVLSPGSLGGTVTVSGMCDADGAPCASAPHPKQRLTAVCSAPLLPGDILKSIL